MGRLIYDIIKGEQREMGRYPHMNLTVESKEFQQVLHNLRLENMSLSTELQEIVIRLVNRNETITPELIKRIVENGKV